MAEDRPAVSVVSRAATTMPVIEGALAFVVISFVASVWDNIPAELRRDAFVLVYGSGAHFIFSFLVTAPILSVAARLKAGAAGTALTLGVFSYTFSSLILQHRGLANLLLEPRWQIPIPGGDELTTLLERTLGADIALYFGPLIFSYAVTAIALLIVWLPARLTRRR